MDTIFALSSGAPPAAIAIVRISGERAFGTVEALTGAAVPPPRSARLRTLRDASGVRLDRALVLAFPGPATATGEDLAELHLHGGRAVVRAVEDMLAGMEGLRRAEPGEFTRRGLAHGVIDLAEAEGLADLLSAETELQRRAAMAVVDGELSRDVDRWRRSLLALAARIEAALDFSDEMDVAADSALMAELRRDAGLIAQEIGAALAAPRSERLRDGIRVVLAGPPNSGKSTLLNALAEREAAIVSPIAGTTRDRIEVAVAREGIPFVLTDTAGLRDSADDTIERIGIARATEAIAAADMILWLGDAAPAESSALWIHSRMDEPGRRPVREGTVIGVSGKTREGIADLWNLLLERARALIPAPGELSLNQRQAALCDEALSALADISSGDELVVADALRRANVALARITGDIGIEATLDALFSRFCIGK